jgi:hypothetical protein
VGWAQIVGSKAGPSRVQALPFTNGSLSTFLNTVSSEMGTLELAQATYSGGGRALHHCGTLCKGQSVQDPASARRAYSKQALFHLRDKPCHSVLQAPSSWEPGTHLWPAWQPLRGQLSALLGNAMRALPRSGSVITSVY